MTKLTKNSFLNFYLIIVSDIKKIFFNAEGSVSEYVYVVAAPVLGILAFSFVLKGPWSGYVDFKLPLYQGITSFYSFALLGFFYSGINSSLIHKKFLYLYLTLLLVPMFFYWFLQFPIFFIVVYSVIFLLKSSISYLYFYEKNKNGYFFFQIISSFLLPFAMLVNKQLLVLSALFLFLLFIKKLKNIEHTSVYKHSVHGIELAKSLLIQSPLILLPLFDIFIVDIIGQNNYQSYIFQNKFVVGFFNLIFSYQQFNLLFNSEKVKESMLLVALNFLAIGIFFFSIMDGFWSFLFLLILCSIAANISSLIIRKILLNGITFSFALTGPIMVLAYYLSLTFFDKYIFRFNGIFVLFTYLATVLPIYIYSIKKKN